MQADPFCMWKRSRNRHGLMYFRSLPGSCLSVNSLPAERPDFYVPVGHFVEMVLQGDSAAREFPEIRAVEFVCPVPFAPGDHPLPFGAVHIDLCGYDFVESESHLPRLLQDADPIPAACRIGARGFGCVYQVVHRPGQMRGALMKVF